MPNDFNPSHLPSNPITGLSPRPEQAAPTPIWWSPNASADWPIPAANFQTNCGYCQGVSASFTVACPNAPIDLAFPVNDQVITKKPLTWLGSLLPENFDNDNDAFVNFQTQLEPMLYYSTCNWRSRLSITANINVAGPPPALPVFKALSLRWYLFYGSTDTQTEYAAGAPAVFGPLGLNGLHYSSEMIVGAANNASRFATGNRHFASESLGQYFGPEVFNELETINLNVEGWCLALLHRFSDEYLDPLSGLMIQFPRWALVAAYTVEGRFKCCDISTWNLAYNPCNQPDHQLTTTPYQP